MAQTQQPTDVAILMLCGVVSLPALSVLLSIGVMLEAAFFAFFPPLMTYGDSIDNNRAEVAVCVEMQQVAEVFYRLIVV